MNIAELTRQLREEIQRQYGVEADIKITIFDHMESNSHINRDVASQLANALSFVFTGEPNIEHWDGGTCRGVWPKCENGVNVSIFYPVAHHG